MPLDFNNLQDDRIISDLITDVYMRVTGMSAAEMRMCEAMSQALISRAWGIAQGKDASRDDIFDIMHNIAEDHGCEYGVALPAISNERGIGGVVTPRGTPLHGQMNVQLFRTEREGELRERRMAVRNSWHRYSDAVVSIVETTEGPMALPEPILGSNMRKWLRTLTARMDGPLSAEAEEKALVLLKGKINASQWRCYLLNNCFPESSKRSGLHYFFRKGLPTVVMSFHGCSEGRVIGTLCFHPMGYHAYTFAGVMCPTDEVIAALLYMRADEHGFWKKSGQWPAFDTRSGL